MKRIVVCFVVTLLFNGNFILVAMASPDNRSGFSGMPAPDNPKPPKPLPTQPRMPPPDIGVAFMAPPDNPEFLNEKIVIDSSSLSETTKLKLKEIIKKYLDKDVFFKEMN